MDSTASLLSPRSSPPSPFSFSPLPSPSSSSCCCSPSSSSSSSSSFSFSPLPSPRPITSASAAPIRSVTGFPDLDSSSSSIWGSPRPFTTLLQQPPPGRPRPSAINVSNYATTAEPSSVTGHPWATAPRRTHYDLLGVTPMSSPSEIRSAYRKLALQHHPDVSPLHQLDTATKFFAEINEAYTVLSDPQKKDCYDLKLALESPRGAMSPMPQMHQQSAASPRKYTDVSTGRVYPSMNSFYREWRRAHA